MRTETCKWCLALVPRGLMPDHEDWHDRLERAIRSIPEPPPVPKRL